MSNTTGEKELLTDYPITEGLTLGTTKLADNGNLQADKDITAQDDWVGIL